MSTTIAQLYLTDLIAWGRTHGWTYKPAISMFVSASGECITIAEMYTLWINYKGE